MVSIAKVLSVVYVLKMAAADWSKHAPAALKKFFEEYGDVRPAQPSSPPSGQPKPKEQILFPSTRCCDLQQGFNDLCDRDFQTFAASCSEVDEMVTLRFMLCRRDEVIWDTRPFEQMHDACGQAVSMAAWRAMGYNNPYRKEGRPINDEERALSINADQPDFGGKPSKQLIIPDDDEIKLATA